MNDSNCKFKILIEQWELIYHQMSLTVSDFINTRYFYMHFPHKISCIQKVLEVRITKVLSSKSDFQKYFIRQASPLPKVKNMVSHGYLYPCFFYLQVNCTASDACFIWMPAGFLNLNLLFVSLCCVGVCQGYVNWLSAGGFVPFSNQNKQTFSFPFNWVSLLGFSGFSDTSEVNLLGDSFIQQRIIKAEGFAI